MNTAVTSNDVGALAWALAGVAFWLGLFYVVWKLRDPWRGLKAKLSSPLRSLAWWLWNASGPARSLLGLVGRTASFLLGLIASAVWKALRLAGRLLRLLVWVVPRELWRFMGRVRLKIKARRAPAPGTRTAKGHKWTLLPLGLGDGLDAATEAIVGQTTWWLVTHWGDWVNRIVESVTFLDEASLRRYTSVDFALPVKHPSVRAMPDSDEILVPLAWLEKRTLTRFDLVDEDANSLSMLETRRNGQVGGACLVAFAAEIARKTGDDLPPGIRRDLYVAACTTGAVADRAVRRLREGRGPAPALRRKLLENEVFSGLVEEFRQQFLILTPCQYDPDAARPTRRVLKFAYDQERQRQPRPRWIQLRFWRRPARHLRNALERLSLRAHRYNLGKLPVGRSTSFHFEVEAPEDLEITYAALDAKSPGDPGYHDLSEQVGVEHRAHLHITNAPLQALAEAYVLLRVQKRGLMHAAAVASLVAAGLLHFGARQILRVTAEAPQTVSGSREAAAVLLVLIPTLVIANLGRPGEHEMATWLVLGTRVLLLLVGLSLVWAVATLAFGYTGDRLDDWWQVSAWVATGASALLVLGAIAPCRPRVTSVEERGIRR